MYKTYNNYDAKPVIKTDIPGDCLLSGSGALKELIDRHIALGERVFVLDMYTGVGKEGIAKLLSGYDADVIDTDSCKKTDGELGETLSHNITGDRVFGYMSRQSLADCFDQKKLADARNQIICAPGRLFFVLGVGAGLIIKGEVSIYFDLTRWEIQLRFRKGASNWLLHNPDAPLLTKYKIGYFIEWRMADRHKADSFHSIDYWVDANDGDNYKIIDKDAFYGCLYKASSRPFRLEPYFDASVWGGQWMKNVFGLDGGAENYGWSFDGVPEENSLNFLIGDTAVSFPCMNLVKLFPERLLGYNNYKRFGEEFPIRFDLLDTFEGGNLSLQVHPTDDYIGRTFGMSYTQDESYFILDAGEDSCVYLGIKEGADREAMLSELEAANRGERVFDAEKYVNKIPVKKFDHILIPAGTIHCSGKDTLVLEISATPYIFTFKLWDWGRVGLDGLPRPVHIGHGANNIRWDRDGQWVRENLVNSFGEKYNTDGYDRVRTGLHSLEFIDTYMYTVGDKAPVSSENGVSVINLIDGEYALIAGDKDQFEPYEIHYGETCIIPAAAGDFYVIRPENTQEIKFICAQVRNG